MSSKALARAALRRHCVASPHTIGPCAQTLRTCPTRLFSRSASQLADPGRERDSFNPLDRLAAQRENAVQVAYFKRRMRFAAMGVAGSFLGFLLLTYMFPPEKPTHLDAPDTSPQFPDAAPVVTAPRTDLVETGTSTIPYFPRSITLPVTESTKTPALPSGIGDSESGFTLMGLGVRSVSFLGIQVYVVGIYVANKDLNTLQAAFVKEAASIESASTLIAGEKEKLRERLNDPVDGEQIWERILQHSGVRSVVRIVPTRNTDYPHLRDGFERGINARVKARPGLAEDETMGESVQQFKAMFGKGQLRKGEVMLLERGPHGELKAWAQSKKEGDFEALGEVKDERISRLMWLGYLGGKTVSSEPCRKSVIDGVMAVVERPIGTAETQVV